MTISITQENNQDSSSYRGFVIQDTLRVLTDSANVQVAVDTVSLEVLINEIDVDSSVSDGTISATLRKSEIVDIKEHPTIDTVYNTVSVLDSNSHFPFQVEQKNNEKFVKKEYIEKSLRNGEALPAAPFRNDWIIGVIIFSIILFSIVHASAKTLFPGIVRFFLLRETKEEEKKMTTLFHWESLLLNISSFSLISIFAYFAISNSNFIPESFSEFRVWIFSVAIIAVALIVRHIICTAIGLFSGTNKIFNDYIHIIYQTYRFAGFFLSIVVILFFYTPLLTARSCLITGCIIIAIFYFIRILRLFLLFINNKVSIFYLILYLCALEFLPVLVSIKYFSGLI